MNSIAHKKEKINAIERFHRYNPYALVLMPNGEFLPVNRHYKPLGLSSRAGHVDYYSQPTVALDLEKIKRVAVTEGPDTNNPGCHTYWFYRDGECPHGRRSGHELKAYKEKLEALGLTYNTGRTK